MTTKTTDRTHNEQLNGSHAESSLQRGLSNRHIQLISIGGAIGTGLFMGAGKTISVAGTSIILVYAVIGFFLFFVMRAMGELLLSNLQFKSFADFCAAYLGPWAGFFMGWSYWLTWVVGAIADCLIIGGYMKFWFPDLPAWIPAISSLVILVGLNALTVKIFGEIEFWFALIKIVAIIALILVGVYFISTSYVSSTGVQASLSHLIDRETFMPHGILGFFAGFQIAIFSFAGIELIGTTAGEAKNPTHTLPKAINSVPLRILLFYVLALSCIISVCSWAQISPSNSPFVQLFVLSGLPMAAAMINFVALTSTMSAGNSGIFSTSRMLFGLACENKAPSMFSKLNSRAVPLNGLLFSSFCMIAGLALLFLIPDLMTAFTLITTVTAILFIYIWSMILLAYIAYRSKYPHLHEQSMFKMPGGTKMACCCLVFFVFVLCLLALEQDTRNALLIIPTWFLILFVKYRSLRKTPSYKSAVAARHAKQV